MADSCLHVICPQGTGHMFMDLGLTLSGLELVDFGSCASPGTHYSIFQDGSLFHA